MTRNTIFALFLLLVTCPVGFGQGENTPVKPDSPTSLEVAWEERKVPENAEEAKVWLARVEASLATVDATAQAELHAQLTAQKEALDSLSKSFSESTLEERKAELEKRKSDLEAEKKRLTALLEAEPAATTGPVDEADLNQAEARKIETETAFNTANANAQAKGQELSTIGEKATTREAQLRSLQQEAGTAESDRVAKSDPTVAAGERRVAVEKSWALRLRVEARQRELSRLKKRQTLGLPTLDAEVAELEKDVADKARLLADREFDRLSQRQKQWIDKQADQARSERDEVADRIQNGKEHEKPFLQLELKKLDLDTERLVLEAQASQLSLRGPVRNALDEARQTEIDIQREKQGEQMLPRDADTLRTRVAKATADVALARETRNRMRETRIRVQAERASTVAKSQVKEIVAAARKEWKTRGGDREKGAITTDAWAALESELDAAVAGKQAAINQVLEEVKRLDNQAEELRVLSENNLAFLQDRLVWTRDPSNVSLQSVELAAEDAGHAFDRLGELPGRIWGNVRGFVSTERTKAIIGGALIILMLLIVLVAHRRLPKSYSFFDKRTGVAHAIGTVMRRTDFSFTVAVIFVGIPWGIGLAQEAIVAVAAIFASPFLYRLGRVLLDVLFSPESDADRIVRIDDKVARLFHITGKIVLNLTAVFVPIGLLMGFAGYRDDNPGFVELWWLLYKVLVHLVLLFTVFRPAVIGRLIRGKGVVAVSVKSWILILYPLIVGAVLFLFVLSSLRYVEAEIFFRGLLLKSAGLLLGGYVAYRVVLRQFLKGRKIESVRTAEEYEGEDAYIAAGRKNFVDTSVRWMLRAVFLLPAAYLLYRTWESVSFGSPESEVAADGVTLDSVLWSLVAISTTVVVTRLIKSGLTFLVLSRSDLDRGMRYTVTTIATYVIWAIGLIVALRLLRVKGEQIAMVVSALMFGLGFGLQSIVKNFVSGLILLVERPVKVGDRVDVSGGSGVVEKITLRATTVMTWEGVGIIIPNEEMIGGTLTNQSLGQPRLRTDLAFGVAYGSDVQLARDIVMETVTNHGLVLKRPEAEVFFMGFGDSSLDFQVRYWTMLTTHRLRVVSDLRYAIEAAFKRNDIEIPFPQRDLHVRTVAPAAGAAFGRGSVPEIANVEEADGTERDAKKAHASEATEDA